MAITVKDIQEKEFSTQARDGYNVEEVDDFLDEIAEQLTALVKENLELNNQVAALKSEVASGRQALAEAQKKIPDYNEKGYFENLQKSMREAMIGAQRIADETRAEAESDAQQIKADAQAAADAAVSQAQAEADRVTADAQARVEALTQQYDAIKAAAQAFKADFSGILESATALLRDKTGLI